MEALPNINSEDDYEPPIAMLMFSEKHFLRCLSVEPKCQALEAPKLDEQVNDCLEKIGKDPYFGSEDAYKFQGQILDLAGPLTCLCAALTSRLRKRISS